MAPGGLTNPFLGTGARLVDGQAEGRVPGAGQPGESFQNPRPSQEGLQPGHREFRGGPVWKMHGELHAQLGVSGRGRAEEPLLGRTAPWEGPRSEPAGRAALPPTPTLHVFEAGRPGWGRQDGSDPCSARPGATVQFHASVSSSVKWGAPCPAQSCARIQRLPKVVSS